MYQKHQSEFEIGAPSASLAEVLGAFSYALDLTEGQPQGHSVRCCWIGTHIARALGLSETEVRDVFYAVLLKDLGCSSNAARVAELFAGDDRYMKFTFKQIGPKAEDFGASILRETGRDADAQERDQAIAHLGVHAPEIMTGLIDTRCTRGADIARQMHFNEDVATAIAHLDEHWDGSGLPSGIAGEQIHLGARIALLAQVADVFFMAQGPDVARAEVESRAGSWFDPQLASVFLDLSKPAGFWDALVSPDLEARLFALEPAQLRVDVDEDWLDDIAAAFGQVIDAKSPYTGGHSERVGLFADLIAAHLGMPPPERRRLRRAAMLHDVGKLGISSRILEKPGKLNEAEWDVMRSHASQTAAILSRIGVMADMATIAASHHERLDGKGYPLQLDSRLISLETRIITVADFFDAVTAARPYRDAMPLDRALAIMRNEVGGALDATVFAALEAITANGIPEMPLPEIGGAFLLR